MLAWAGLELTAATHWLCRANLLPKLPITIAHSYRIGVTLTLAMSKFRCTRKSDTLHCDSEMAGRTAASSSNSAEITLTGDIENSCLIPTRITTKSLLPSLMHGCRLYGAQYRGDMLYRRSLPGTADITCEIAIELSRKFTKAVACKRLSVSRILILLTQCFQVIRGWYNVFLVFVSNLWNQDCDGFTPR